MDTPKQLYYTAPPNDVFEELKEAALEVWDTYDDPYRTEKKDKVESMENVRDNFMVMVSMFDTRNQKKLAGKLSQATKDAVRNRLAAGGADARYTSIFN